MFGFFIQFALVLVLAKSISSTFQFYKAALVYFVVILILGLLFGSGAGLGAVLLISLLKGTIALLYFYLLDRYEDTIVSWLIIFAVGFLLLLSV
jgi:hypothetical protein